MPRYYVNLFNDVDVLDEEGQEFRDLAAAKAVAIAGARDLMAEHIRAGKAVTLSHRIEIADETGKTLAVLPFGERITIVP
jgi:hypothetical protein